MMEVSLSIDPGLSGTGLAAWNRQDVLAKNRNMLPLFVKNLYPDKECPTLMMKTRDLLAKIDANCAGTVVKNIWMEMPAFFDDASGHMVAKNGDLLKLTFFVGAVASHFSDCKVKLFTPQEWKGQLTKEQVISKLRDINPRLEAKSHGWDAIGIGYFGTGIFTRCQSQH